MSLRCRIRAVIDALPKPDAADDETAASDLKRRQCLVQEQGGFRQSE
jgi:hypothetical protein